jgi:hypothetical protein
MTIARTEIIPKYHMKAEPPIGKSVKITGTIFAPISVTSPLHIHLKLGSIVTLREVVSPTEGSLLLISNFRSVEPELKFIYYIGYCLSSRSKFITKDESI